MEEPILIGKKGPERKESFMGPWTLIDYWPYIVNGKIIVPEKASEIALKLNCQLPKRKAIIPHG
jgi:hypothetical protein